MLIALVVAAGVVVYFFVSGLSGNLSKTGTGAVTTELSLDAYNFPAAGPLTFTLRNVGNTSTTVEAVYFNGNPVASPGCSGTARAHEDLGDLVLVDSDAIGEMDHLADAPGDECEARRLSWTRAAYSSAVIASSSPLAANAVGGTGSSASGLNVWCFTSLPANQTQTNPPPCALSLIVMTGPPDLRRTVSPRLKDAFFTLLRHGRCEETAGGSCEALMQIKGGLFVRCERT